MSKAKLWAALALFAGVAAQDGDEPACAPGWKEFNGACYWSTKEGTAVETTIECQQSGGNPVHVHDETEQNFLQIEFPGTFWIGLRQLNLTNAECDYAWCGWTWQDDHTPAVYTNWQTGQPRDSYRATWPYHDRGRMECALMENPPNGNGGWIDMDCSQKHYRALCSQHRRNVGRPFLKCPAGKTLFRGVCWAVRHKYLQTLADARAECSEDGGAIATVRDEHDERFLLYELGIVQSNKYRKFWVGYTQGGTSSQWDWLNSNGGGVLNGSNFTLEHRNQHQATPAMKCTYATWLGWDMSECEIEGTNYLERPFAFCSYPSTLVHATCKTLEKQFRGGCYWITQKETGRGYDLAALNCESQGGIIAPIPDNETSVWVYDNLVAPLQEESAFIGLRQDFAHPSCEGLNATEQRRCGWVWEHGRGSARYQPWEPGQPDDGIRYTKTAGETGFDNCAAISWRKHGTPPEPLGAWEDRHCGTTLRAVCMRKATAWEPLEAKCAPGQLQVRGRCFWLTPRQASWETAQEMCGQFGATLAKVRSRYEEEQIHKEFGGDFRFVWIGLSRSAPMPHYCTEKKYKTDRDRCNWRWDEDGWEPTINRWGGGIDASGKRQCVAMEAGSYGSWYPQHCLRPRRGLCSIQASPEPTPVCMPGQKYFNRKCFWLTEAALTFQSGEIECSRAGGTLAALGSEAEDDFVASEFVGYQDGPVFLGLQQTVKAECNASELNSTELLRCGWEWTDATTHLNWTNWNLGEPNDYPNMVSEAGSQDCVVMYPKGQWGDLSCMDKLPALCQKVAVQSAQPRALNRCDEEVEQQERLLGEFKYISVHVRSIQLLTAPAEHGDKLDFIDQAIVGGNDDKISARIEKHDTATDESQYITRIPMERDSIEEFRFKGRGQIEYPNPYPKFTIYQGESIDATVAARDFMVEDTEGKNRLQYDMFALLPTGTALNLKVKLEKRDSLVDLLQVALEVAGYDAICLDDVVMTVLAPGAGKLGKRALKKGMKAALKTKRLSKSSKRKLKDGYDKFKKWKKTDTGQDVIDELQGQAEEQTQVVVSDVLETVLGAKYCVDVVDTIEPFANALLGTREALYEFQLVLEGDVRNLDLPITHFSGSLYNHSDEDEDVHLSINVKDMTADTATFYGGQGVNIYWVRDAGAKALGERPRTIHIVNFAQEDILELSEFEDLWNNFDAMPLREEETVNEDEYVVGVRIHDLYIRMTLDCAFDLKPSHFIFAKNREAPPLVIGVGQKPLPPGTESLSMSQASLGAGVATAVLAAALK